jgi:hypothetical protein
VSRCGCSMMCTDDVGSVGGHDSKVCMIGACHRLNALPPSLSSSFAAFTAKAQTTLCYIL